MNLFPFICAISIVSCTAQLDEEVRPTNNNREDNSIAFKYDGEIMDYYELNKGNDQGSKSVGSVSNGKLENAKLVPYYGKNFTYFDKDSYLGGRAFVNGKVKSTILEAYYALYTQLPERHFYLMECSNQEGGKLFPHKTHQNGLSVDFMMRMTKNGNDYYGLDTIGKEHYWLSFNDDGKYSSDTAVKVDFNLIARHILLLNEKAKDNGLRITKVIIRIEFKDELFATENGQKLKSSGIYVVKGLTKLINALHDEHYHVDFGKI